MRLPRIAAIVRFEQVGVSLGGRLVLRDLDLVVEPGEAVGIAGPNGSGKTTLIRTAATLVSTDRGSLEVLGEDAAKRDLVATRRAIGMIGHQPTLIPELTLVENLNHVARLAGVDIARVRRALQVVGLDEASHRRAEACSFGMKRRVEIAHLLLTRPQLLLLDEAASGLDESARDLIEALVGSVRQRGGGCIVVSHDRGQLAELCTRVASLADGRLETAR
ncbi:MAG TPA: ABC transporter ATP-binding protein [Acidimicrobiia bacterium]